MTLETSLNRIVAGKAHKAYYQIDSDFREAHDFSDGGARAIDARAMIQWHIGKDVGQFELPD